MDPSLLRESKSFKKRALEVPSVENKKKKEKALAEEPKVKKRSSFASPKLDASNYKSFVGSTPHKFGVLAKIVKHMQKRHLEGEDHPLTLDEILDETTQLDVSSSTKTWLANTALPENPKIETTDENTYMYKPVYKIRDKRSFLKLLRTYDLKGLGGVSLKDIQESLPNSEKILKHLQNDIIRLPGADKDEVLFYNDKTISFNVDEDFAKLWRQVPVDIDDEKIEQYLQKQGMKSMQNTKKRQVATVLSRKQMMKKKGLKRARDNVHLADLLNLETGETV
ncbi:transcription initiation factor IIE subunit beta-like [Artemia franciscana]|uniref:Transcription initiation factor IIE subunit beta n=1 Tax=Artemia franciscana TaxID=6661 RepID=A0AA88IJ46_ARTSF|nr:hypothetical protein QYM36_004002 [Artemia franciscana]